GSQSRRRTGWSVAATASATRMSAPHAGQVLDPNRWRIQPVWHFEPYATQRVGLPARGRATSGVGATSGSATACGSTAFNLREAGLMPRTGPFAPGAIRRPGTEARAKQAQAQDREPGLAGHGTSLNPRQVPGRCPDDVGG